MKSKYSKLEVSPKKRKAIQKMMSPIAEVKNNVTERKKLTDPEEKVKKLYCFTHSSSLYIAVVFSNFQIHVYLQDSIHSNKVIIMLPNAKQRKKIKKIASKGINLVITDNFNFFYIVNLISEEYKIVESFKVTALIVLKSLYFVTGDKVGGVHFWSMTGENIFALADKKFYVDKLKAVADDKFVISAHLNCTINILNVAERKIVKFDTSQKVIDIDSDINYVYVLILGNRVIIYKIEEITISHYKNVFLNGNFISVSFLACSARETTYFILNSSIKVYIYHFLGETCHLEMTENMKIKGENIKLIDLLEQSLVFGLKNNKIFRINLRSSQVKTIATSLNYIFGIITIDSNSIIACSNSGNLYELFFK